MAMGSSHFVGLLLSLLGFYTLAVSGQYCVEDCGLPTPGYGLYSLVFDPRTQTLARLDLYSDLYDNMTSFTIEARIFLTPGQQTARPILFKGEFNEQGNGNQDLNNGLTFSQEWLLSVTPAGTLRFTMGGDLDYGFDIESPVPLVTNEWIHVAATVDYFTSTAILYTYGDNLDGTSQNWLLPATPGPYRTSFDDGQTLSPRKPFGRIAAGWYNPIFSTSPQVFNGRIDDIRIWSRVLGQTELSLRAGTALDGNEPGLVSYHPLNEGQGSTTTSPWPTSGPGVIDATTEVIEGVLTFDPPSQVSRFWTLSEFALNNPPTPFGVTNQLATDARTLQLYANIDNSDNVKFLRYGISSFPQNGALFQNGAEIQPGDLISKSGSPNVWPVVQYVRYNDTTGDDSFVYFAVNSRDETSDLSKYATVTLVDQCETIDSCGICNGDNSLCGCDGIAFSNKTYDDCGVCDGHNLNCSGCDGFPYSGLEYDGCGVCGGYNETCGGCDGVAYSGLVYDACGVCNGTNDTCLGCDSVPNSGKEYDDCGVCGGDNSTCAGCDGVPNSNLTYDACGVCDGHDESCLGCDGVPNSGKRYDVCGICDGGHGDHSVAKDRCGVCFGNDSCVGCDGVPFSGAEIDDCGACSMPWEANRTCMGCDGVPRSGKQYDKCGVCGGDNNCSSGCDHQPGSNKRIDACGVCGGDDSTCVGCDGIPEKNVSLRAVFDECGVCGGNGSTCADCDGVPNGPNPPGPCGCTNSTDCLDCTGCPYGPARYDDCGVCDGNNDTCAGCDGVPHSGLQYDHCGVCGGNDSSCIDEWCNSTIPNSQLDACGQCAGDNSTCQCVAYKNYTLVQMDCILLNYTFTNSLLYIDLLLSTLNDTLDEISQAELGEFNDIVGGEIRQLNDFTDICVDQLCKELGNLITKLIPAV